MSDDEFEAIENDGRSGLIDLKGDLLSSWTRIYILISTSEKVTGEGDGDKVGNDDMMP